MNQLSPESQAKVDTRALAKTVAEFAVECRNLAPNKEWFWKCLGQEIETLCDAAKLPPQERTIRPDEELVVTNDSGVTLHFDTDETQDAEAAVEQCDEILSLCQELPERAEDFGMSVIEKVEGIRKTIVESDRVTPNQKAALDNMQQGVSNWIN